MKGIQANREDKYIKARILQRKVTRAYQIFEDSSRTRDSSTLLSSQLTILLLHLEKVERASLMVCVTSEGSGSYL